MPDLDRADLLDLLGQLGAPDDADVLAAARALHGKVSEAGLTSMEFVLRFTLSHPGLSSTIVGTSSADHLRSNLVVAEKGPLPADVYEEAKRRLEPASV